MSEKVIKPKQHPDFWEWQSTIVSHFSCFPSEVENFLHKEAEMYKEQGYEIVDSYVVQGDGICTVKLLLKPIKNSKTDLVIKAEPQPINYNKVKQYLPEKIEVFSAELYGAEEMLKLTLHGVGFRRFLELLTSHEKTILKNLLEEEKFI